MNESNIKEAFVRAKQDIFCLGEELLQLKQEILDMKIEFKLVSQFIEDIKLKQFQQTHTPTNQQTLQHIIPTQTPFPTDTPTHPHELKGLISSYKPISTGNAGVPTDRPTDRQTDQQTLQHIHLSQISPPPLSLDKAQEFLAGLDSLKKEVRFKFKRLTTQEMQVFCMIYELEESNSIIDYKLLASKLNLSESSIRDYIGKIQKKGIPITKEKLNNKRILLHISPDLKQIASLNTIVQLREL